MLHISADPQGKFTVSAHGETWLECPAMIAVDANGEKDGDERFLPMMSYEQKTEEGKTTHIWRTHSNLWTKKEYVLEEAENAARFFVRVEGRGKVDALRFFGCHARYEAAEYLLPMANHADYSRNLRMITEPGVIELGYFTPPCYVYPLHIAGCAGWLGVGLAARAGQYNFHQFLYQNENQNRCGFEVPLYGQTTVDGAWESQSLLFVTGEDAYDVVHAAALCADLTRTAVLGESAGGCLAAALVTLPMGDPSFFKSAVLVNAITDLSDPRWGARIAEHSAHPLLKGKSTAEKIALLSPAQHISAQTCPTLLLHGEQDNVVFPFHSVKFHDLLNACGVKTELDFIADTSHAFLLAEYMQERHAPLYAASAAVAQIDAWLAGQKITKEAN